MAIGIEHFRMVLWLQFCTCCSILKFSILTRYEVRDTTRLDLTRNIFDRHFQQKQRFSVGFVVMRRGVYKIAIANERKQIVTRIINADESMLA